MGAMLKPFPGFGYEEAVRALREAKKLAYVPFVHSQKLRDSCYLMLGSVREMLAYPPVAEGGDDLRRLAARLDRVIELSNMMECADLARQVTEAMEAAYHRLP